MNDDVAAAKEAYLSGNWEDRTVPHRWWDTLDEMEKDLESRVQLVEIMESRLTLPSYTPKGRAVIAGVIAQEDQWIALLREEIADRKQGNPPWDASRRLQLSLTLLNEACRKISA